MALMSYHSKTITMSHNHSHSHDHGHHHHHHFLEKENYNKAFALAVILNLAFTILETGYAVLAHSMSLLADAGHNLADVFGLLMGWGASVLLYRAASEKYSYGYKKMTLLAALANALLLVAASAVIIFESVDKLLHPVAVNELIIIIVAAIGIVINGGTALLFLRGQQKDLNIKAAYWHLAADALLSVGVVITGAIIFFTHWFWLDPIVGLAIIMVILHGTWGLLRGSVDLLLGAVPHNVNQQEVRDYLQHITGVEAIHDFHIWALSTQEVALTAHLIMPTGTLSDADHAEINHVLRDKFSIHHITLQVETGQVSNPCGQAETC